MEPAYIMNTTGTAGIRNSITCFTCNQEILGAKVSLSNSKTAHTGTAIPVKISELMGEDFLVILTGEDYICKRCNNLFNLMDRLQSVLTIVQNALLGHIRTKYNLPGSSDSNVSNDIQLSVNGVPYNEFANMNHLSHLSKRQSTSIQDPVNNNASLSFKSTGSLSNTSNIDDSNKRTTKVYKCGFCNMQSKDLNVVKNHMRTHETPDPKRAEKRPPASPIAARPIKRKLFRCQVCAVSYLDRKSCLNHIKANHSTSDSQSSSSLSDGKTSLEKTPGSQQTVSTVIDLTEDKVLNGDQETADRSKDVSQNGAAIESGANILLDDESASQANEATLQDNELTSQSNNATEHSEQVVSEGTENEKAADVVVEESNTVQHPAVAAHHEATDADNESNSKTVSLDLDAMLEALHSDANAPDNSENTQSVSEQMVPES